MAPGMVVDLNAGKDSRWKRFENTDMGVACELYGPTTDEWADYSERFSGKKNTLGQRVFIAKNWSRLLEGFRAPDGSPLPDTPEVRAEVFRLVPEFWTWAAERLADFAAWRAEGNANSGAA